MTLEINMIVYFGFFIFGVVVTAPLAFAFGQAHILNAIYESRQESKEDAK